MPTRSNEIKSKLFFRNLRKSISLSKITKNLNLGIPLLQSHNYFYRIYFIIYSIYFENDLIGAIGVSGAAGDENTECALNALHALGFSSSAE